MFRPNGMKYEKAKEWRIPCVNALWLCDILLGNFEALRQIQNNRYTVFNLQDALAPSSHMVSNLLGMTSLYLITILLPPVGSYTLALCLYLQMGFLLQR